MDFADKIEMNLGDLEFLITGLEKIDVSSADSMELGITFFCRLAREKIKQTSEIVGEMRLSA